ncbi:unnamed protein product [Blumeria hordei]|uniref:Uncharacterized protein n=1 Tax=Blumeria hordei TaxID=2867405 RepID=A0A383UJS4_BLUHO|nr:unnamed protein product [Blumeria hordei]
MKLTRLRASSWLLLPPLYFVITVGPLVAAQSQLGQNAHYGEINTNQDPAVLPMDVNTKTKFDVGTKDAPVDGKDGKPHAGPWVWIDKDPKTTKPLHELQKEEDKQRDIAIPEVGQDGRITTKNGGVMDDPTRELPKHGTTGTEGGVSEKEKARKAHEGQTGERLEKKPESPKEAPQPLPDKMEDIYTDKMKSKDGDEVEKPTKDTLAGLEKPDNLPDKLNNLPHPLPGSAQKDHLDIQKSNKESSKYELTQQELAEGLIKPLHSFFLSLTMILFSEIGDKTFLIAALMAMKHDRITVFSAAFAALFIMTVLSAVLGHSVPTLIPKRYTNYLASGLFLVFGVRMLNEGLAMSSQDGVAAEMKEVEMELEEKEHLSFQPVGGRSTISPYALEMGLGRSRSKKSRIGTRLSSPLRSPSSSSDRTASPPHSTVKNRFKGLSNLLSLLLSPVWVQTFVMTFLGEWGDRSQLATIAMAAGQDYWWVSGGAITGHAICTGVAVIGGRAMAGRVSMRLVTLGSAVSFLVFGVIYFAEACYA